MDNAVVPNISFDDIEHMYLDDSKSEDEHGNYNDEEFVGYEESIKNNQIQQNNIEDNIQYGLLNIITENGSSADEVDEEEEMALKYGVCTYYSDDEYESSSDSDQESSFSESINSCECEFKCECENNLGGKEIIIISSDLENEIDEGDVNQEENQEEVYEKESDAESKEIESNCRKRSITSIYNYSNDNDNDNNNNNNINSNDNNSNSNNKLLVYNSNLPLFLSSNILKKLKNNNVII